METISIDLRKRILRVYDKGEETRQSVADRFCVSLGMVKKLLQQRRKTGEIAPRHCFSGRKPTITDKHKRQLRSLIDEHPDMTLDELRLAIGLDCSLPAIHYVLNKMGLSYKKRVLPLPSNNALTSKCVGKSGKK